MIEQITLKGIIWAILIIWFVFYSVLGIGGRDNTDSATSKKRSGLSLYTDYGTGLQYIKGGLFGNLQPRLNRNGDHISVYDDAK